MVHDINFLLNITKPFFDLIITIMLHDACHDFDNGKTDAPFKEFFLAQDAIYKSANNRLIKIKSFLSPTGPPGVSGGGGSSHIGGSEVTSMEGDGEDGDGDGDGDGGDEVTSMVGDDGGMLIRTNSSQKQQNEEHRQILSSLVVDESESPPTDPTPAFQNYIAFLLETKYPFESLVGGETTNEDEITKVSKYFWQFNEFKSQTDDIDFILGLINKISKKILYGVLIEHFKDILFYVREGFSQLNDEKKILDKYFIEELLRMYTNDFTKDYNPIKLTEYYDPNIFPWQHPDIFTENYDPEIFQSKIYQYTNKIIQIEARNVDNRSFLYTIEDIIKYEGSEVFKDEIQDTKLYSLKDIYDTSDLPDITGLDDVEDVMSIWKAYENGMEKFKESEAKKDAAEQFLVNRATAEKFLANPAAYEQASAEQDVTNPKNPKNPKKRELKKDREQRSGVNRRRDNSAGQRKKKQEERVRQERKMPTTMEQDAELMNELGGGGPPPPQSVIYSNFDKYLEIVQDPSSYLSSLLGNTIVFTQTDTSFIEDDDGESYKQDPASLESEATDLDNSGDPDAQEEAQALRAKSKNIKKALKFLLNTDYENINVNTFKTKKNYYDEIKKKLNNTIKVYLKGAYRRAMGGDYMDTLGGFTILELYELVIYNTHTNDQKKVYRETNEQDPVLSEYLSSLYSMLGTWETAGENGRYTGSQKNKIAVLRSIIGSGPNDQSVVQWINLGGELQKQGTIGEFLKNIINNIIILEKYNKYCSKVIDFLDGQQSYFGSSDKKLTAAERTRRSVIFTEILNKYEPHFEDDIKNTNEWKRLYTLKQRPSGPSLDNHLWKGANAGQAPVAFLNIIQAAKDQLGITEYINNAIPSTCAQILASYNFKPVCFTSVIDPMGSFGDCYPVPDPNINGDINININANDNNNHMIINLKVEKKGDITLTGSVNIKMDGNVILDVNDINISRFKTKKPLSIANTVKLFKEHDVEHNSKQIVRKFLGDFLQAVEAVSKGLLYLSGDKPATVMYYILNALYTTQQTGTGFKKSIGGFVDKSCNVYTKDDINIANLGGGGVLKDKKRVRRSRKRRTNRRKKTQRRKTNKRRSNRRKTNKRRSNRRKTNKRRTVRGKTTKRRSVRRNK